MDERRIKIEDYKYDLPESKIARYPLPDRASSRLLVFKDGSINDESFKNIASHFDKRNLLVFNNTRVIRARLQFRKATGAAIEIFCLEPAFPFNYETAFSSTTGVKWHCLVGNLKKWKTGKLSMEVSTDMHKTDLIAEIDENNESGILIKFTWDNKLISFSEILMSAGHVPVPPYLNRDDEDIDKLRYQTVYSRIEGSVAAPTAGLHFTDQVLRQIKEGGTGIDEVTLHVGAGTFVPVKSETIGKHRMHTEHFSFSRQLIDKLSSSKVIAVGTTTVRTLESIYWIGNSILNGNIDDPYNIHIAQWLPYETKVDYEPGISLKALADFMDGHGLDSLSASTSIIIVPGYRFRIIGGVITNFHMPGSTLLLLVSAIVGNSWKDIYHHALEHSYRFLSYGDSSLLYCADKH